MSLLKNSPDTACATIASFSTSTGATLYYEWWMPPQPKGMLLVVHGIGEHSGRYGPFVRYFFERGYAVALYDQRGHGQSSGERGHIEHLQDLLGDLADFVEHSKRAFPQLPMFMVGHSFGGQLALNFVVRYNKNLRGIILSSPNIGLKMKLSPWRLWLGESLYRWWPRAKFGQKVHARFISRDAAIVAAYEQDPRVVRQFTMHSVIQILRNLDIVMALSARIHLPALFLHAGDDQICDPEATRQFYRRIPVARKRLKVYEGMYNEIFNEAGKEIVFRDIELWLADMLRDERPQTIGEHAASAPAPRVHHRGDVQWMGQPT